ncbi:cyclase family protein [Paracraurococcus ruber]|nr:cyclase family protein [Paracraurococcus ruber]TDG31135.1 cyclase family protein [Paracraurococcus ruber]
MTILSRRAALAAAAGLAAALPTQGSGQGSAQGTPQAPQAWSPPDPAQRCPGPWGAADRRGAMNRQTPETVKRAAGLIRTGEIVELGRVLEQGMPLQATRQFHIHTKPLFMNPQPNRRGSNEEMVIGEMGQVGTQFDMFPHQTIGNHTYNCVEIDRIATRNGFAEMGVETVGNIFTRGVLLDIAALKGVPMLEAGYEITPDDVDQALRRQSVQLAEADAVLFHTGWGTLWGRDNARYMASNPGIGVAAAEQVIRRGPILMGADVGTVEVSPSRTLPSASLPIHQIALVVNGVHLLENLKLDELAGKGRAEFVLNLQPLKLKGGTGSTVAPTAIL